MGDRVCAVSYNIRHDSFDDGTVWRNRRDTIARVIREADADVVGLQEAHGYQFGDLSDRLPSYTWTGVGERTGEFNPIGYRAARFNRLDSGVEWLSERPAEPESVGWDGAFARVLTGVTLRDRRTARVLAVFNTHFDHRGETARRESARLIRRRVDDLPPEVSAIVLGDFNVDEATPPYEVMVADTFDRPVVDARRVAVDNGRDPGTTRTSFDGLVPGRRIDHVFVTADLPVTRYAIPTTTLADGRFPSDHLPVVATVALD